MEESQTIFVSMVQKKLGSINNLSRMAGLTRGQIDKIIQGSRAVRKKELEAIAKPLGLTVTEIINLMGDGAGKKAFEKGDLKSIILYETGSLINAAQMLGLDRYTLYKKMKGPAYFKDSQVDDLASILNLTKQETTKLINDYRAVPKVKKEIPKKLKLPETKLTPINNASPELTRAYEGLGNAIIYQAVVDYRKAKRTEASSTETNKLESFFTSDWFNTLTEVDGTRLLNDLKKEKQK